MAKVLHRDALIATAMALLVTALVLAPAQVAQAREDLRAVVAGDPGDGMIGDPGDAFGGDPNDGSDGDPNDGEDAPAGESRVAGMSRGDPGDGDGVTGNVGDPGDGDERVRIPSPRMAMVWLLLAIAGGVVR